MPNREYEVDPILAKIITYTDGDAADSLYKLIMFDPVFTANHVCLL